MKRKEKDVHLRDEDEENVYSGDVREDLIEGDEISAEEEGFMAGYDEAEEDEGKKSKKKSPDEDEEEGDEEPSEE